MKHDLSRTRVVLTGASGGIGTAAAERLRGLGASVAGIDLHPGEEEVLAADVRDRAQIEEAIAEAAERLGGIDILINNAGIGRAQDSGDFPQADARAVLDVNFFGAWNVTAAALPHLLAARGHVVNVSSGLAFVDVPFGVAYTASKRALSAYSEALRAEYAGRLTVSTIFPGYIRTAIHAESVKSGVSLEGLARADTVAGAADAIVKACTKRPRRITTSRRSAVELWCARYLPAATATVMNGRVRRWARNQLAPTFLRFPDERLWRKAR